MKSVVFALLATHIAIGTIAVIVGLVALVMPKPVEGRTAAGHRRSGIAFLWSMAVVIGTAAVLTIIKFNPYFAGLTASATIAVFSGYRVLGRKRPDLGPSQRATIVDWAMTILIFLTGVMLTGLGVSGRITSNLPVVYALGGGCIVYSVYDLYRFAWPLRFPYSANLWLYEHLVKMIGGYFGAVAAFSGSVLVLLPEPWRQLWATTLGQALAIVLVIYYRRKLNRKSRGKRGAVDVLAKMG
jgi:hypothetical protein